MVSIEEATLTTQKALQAIGWDEEDATLQASIMVAAETYGNNQGLVKMYKPEVMKPAANAGKPTVERETPTSAVVNGNQAPGMLAAVKAANLAVEKALANGPIAMVTVYNTSTSSGMLGYYPAIMAKKGLIGIVMCNSPEYVAAATGAKPVYGTNPMAFAFPKPEGEPLIFDMATSAIAKFGVITAQAKGGQLPEGCAYDSSGNWTTDPNACLDGGAIACFGGHKGAGLALMVELLAGALSGGATLGQVESKEAAKSWGHTMLAIQPGGFVKGFEDKVASVCNAVKASGPSVRVPGERSSKTATERISAGKLPVPTSIWESIQKTANVRSRL